MTLHRILSGATILLIVLALGLFVPTTALAHGDMSRGVPDAPVTAPPAPAAAGPMVEPVLTISVPDHIPLASDVDLAARLTRPSGKPVPGATISFEQDVAWGDEFAGHMVLGTAVTDETGTARFTARLHGSGEAEIAAVFAGGGDLEPLEEETTTTITGDAQLYSPSVGLRIPWLNLWPLVAVIALVWGLYLVAGRRLIAISRASDDGDGDVPAARTRRQFLRRAFPFALEAGIASMGALLIGIVARSPRTHGNLMASPATERYRRTPVARVGIRTDMREMPAPLERTVGFAAEVLPIFLMSAGPHVVQPKHSPPPGGLRLDSYESVMAEEGVVVPGEPESSEIVEHLLSPGMQMPPSVPPLPDEQIRLIVTWIAQGARDN